MEDPALAPNGFTLQHVRARIDRVGDVWAKLRAQQGSVTYALQRFAQLHPDALQAAPKTSEAGQR